MYLSGLGFVNVQLTVNGKDASNSQAARVGDVYTLAIPGYDRVWLEQTQNGAPQYSGPFTLPMTPYTLQPRDQGSYQAAAYTLDANGNKDGLLAQWTFYVAAAPILPPTQLQPNVVTPQPTTQIVSRPLIFPTSGGPPVVNVTPPDINITTPAGDVTVQATNYMPYVLGGLALLFLMRRR